MLYHKGWSDKTSAHQNSDWPSNFFIFFGFWFQTFCCYASKRNRKSKSNHCWDTVSRLQEVRDIRKSIPDSNHLGLYIVDGQRKTIRSIIVIALRLNCSIICNLDDAMRDFQVPLR